MILKNHLGLRSGFSLVGFCLDFWGGLVTIMWCLMLRCKISGKLWLLKSVESTPEQRKAPKAWSSTEIEGVCLVQQDDNNAYCDIKTTALCRIWWLKISPKPSQTTKPPFLTSWAAPSALSAPDWGDLVRGPQWSGEGEKSWKSSAKQRKRSKTSQETLARKTTSRSKQTNKKHQQNFFKDEKFSPPPSRPFGDILTNANGSDVPPVTRLGRPSLDFAAVAARKSPSRRCCSSRALDAAGGTGCCGSTIWLWLTWPWKIPEINGGF